MLILSFKASISKIRKQEKLLSKPKLRFQYILWKLHSKRFYLSKTFEKKIHNTVLSGNVNLSSKPCISIMKQHGTVQVSQILHIQYKSTHTNHKSPTKIRKHFSFQRCISKTKKKEKLLSIPKWHLQNGLWKIYSKR